DMQRQIEIRAAGTAQDSRNFFVSRVDAGSLTLPLGGGAANTAGPAQNERPQQLAESESPVAFTWDVEGRPIFTTRPKLTPQGLQVENSPITTQVVMFPANFTLNPEETSSRLSDLRKTNQLQFLLDTIRPVFPDVKDVSIENNVGVWMVYISTPSV